MTRRRYRQGRRAEATAATRQRIVEATLTLHDAQGITRTSLRDVAGSAKVAPATVLHHFPHMDDLIRACGELSDQLAPMPTEAVLVGAADRMERIRYMALALFEWWEVLGQGWDHLQIDRRTLSRVDTWLGDVSRRHRALAAAALGTDADAAQVDLLTAITTNEAWRALRDAGMTARQAAGHVARLIGAQLLEPPSMRNTEAIH